MSDTAGSGHTFEGRGVPTGALAAKLHETVAGVMRVLETADEEAKRNGALVPARVIENYSHQVEAKMLLLADVLAEVIYGSGGPVDLVALRRDFLEPILNLSRSLPVFNRAEEWRQNKDRTVELHELIVEGRAVGFDAETFLLDHFYENTIYARALRTRILALAKLIETEAGARFEAGARELCILVLGANSVLNLASLFPRRTGNLRLSVTIVDGDTRALRSARQYLQETLGARPSVVRMKPQSLARNYGRTVPPYDLVLSLMQYDMLTPDTALGLTRSVGQLLAPGGALLTGGFLSSVPKSYRAIAAVFAELPWQYWDEPMWRDMLSRLPFDLPAGRFETLEPATIIVLARRQG